MTYLQWVKRHFLGASTKHGELASRIHLDLCIEPKLSPDGLIDYLADTPYEATAKELKDIYSVYLMNSIGNQ
jgi:hypothetical protein